MECSTENDLAVSRTTIQSHVCGVSEGMHGFDQTQLGA